MESLQGLAIGFKEIFSMYNMLVIFAGSMIGTVVGALPGLGPSAGIALMLPLTFSMPVNSALCLLVGVYMGTMYGGRITSILINTPGDAPAIMTAIDGYPLMIQGKGGLALGISAFSSFAGGFFGLLVLVFGAPVVTRIAVNFGPHEYFMLMVMGLCTISLLAGKSILKAIFMSLFGFLIGMIGSDYVSGFVRFAFTPELIEGVDFVAIIIGLYGIGEVLINIEKSVRLDLGKPAFKIKEFIPTKKDIAATSMPTLRGSVIGTLIGILPGAGGTIATFLSYAVEKKISKHPEKFGNGALEGVAAPEGANNASVPGALIPLVTLGIPGSGGTAIMLGALIMYGLRPGPLLMVESGNIVWAMIAGLIIANIMLLFSNILLIPVFINIIRLVQKYLSPIVAALCVLGAYSLNYGLFNVWVILVFGIIGYFMKKLQYPSGPLILSVVLAPLTENYFRQSLMISHGNYGAFFARPVSLGIFIVIVGAVAASIISKLMKKSKKQALAK
ncbi:MAG: Tripartite tricarboxylate transporter TctA family [Firmicutes bacterium]|nr:Tripartite tricarboxylate transporter TctA family [Bacillota bacterium]MDI6705631.1 tripartite tricarboxylate transporter permease [Bacillota bacterium]